MGLPVQRTRAQAGAVDISFDPGSGANGDVYAVASQPDGKVVIGGAFTSVNGVARNRVARLNPDGTLDLNFNPGAGANANVQVVTRDASGRILVGGFFTSVNGNNRNYLARLNPDGSLDTSFNPGTGANGNVWAIAVQSDTKILVGGEFTTFAGSSRSGLTRVTSSGAPDDTFAPGAAATNGVIYALAIQSDNRIIIGGSFTNYAGNARTNIARINANGTHDATFNPGTGAGGAGNAVNALGLQSDGKIIAGGDFDTFNGVSHKFIARLLTNGTYDATFNVGSGPDNTIQGIQVLSDNRILIAGDFSAIDSDARNFVARLNTNGTPDATFNTAGGAMDTIVGVAAQADGRVVIGGYFTLVGSLSRGHIARLHGRSDGLSPLLSGAKNASNYQISFQSLTNLAYLLEYTDSLPARRWNPLAIVFGDGATKSLTDPAPGASQRFYRLRVIYSEPYIFNAAKVGNAFQLSVSAFAWKTYVIEYKNSLSDASWTALPGVAGDNTLKTLIDSTATAPQRFYRIRAQ